MTARYIILTPNLFSERDWVRFECAQFADAGYEVMAVEIGEALGVAGGLTPRGEFQRQGNVRVMDGPEALERVIAGIGDSDLVVVNASLSETTRPLFRLLGRHDVGYVAFSLGVLPLTRFHSFLSALSMGEYLGFKLQDVMGRAWRLKRLFGEMAACRLEYFRFSPPRLWLTAGAAMSPLLSQLPWAWRARRVPVASFDYLTAQRAASGPGGALDQAVFLDEAFVDHPDFALLGRRSPVTEEHYWPALERLFQAVEAASGLKVIIAAHPKSGGIAYPPAARRLAAAKTTCELVRDSALVICHASTAVSFAVYYRKPLLFVTSDEIEGSGYRGAIARMSSCFGLRRVNADRFNAGELALPGVDERKYRRYEHEYLRARGAVAGSPWAYLRSRGDRHAPKAGQPAATIARSQG